MKFICKNLNYCLNLYWALLHELMVEGAELLLDQYISRVRSFEIPTIINIPIKAFISSTEVSYQPLIPTTALTSSRSMEAGKQCPFDEFELS